MKLTAKDKARIKLLDYLGDPENDFLPRIRLSTDILGYKTEQYIHQLFTSSELNEIEAEAFELRKKNSVRERSELYKSLYMHGKKGNVQAAKEFLERTEGKVTDKQEITGKDGKNLIDIPGLTQILNAVEKLSGKSGVEAFKNLLINDTDK